MDTPSRLKGIETIDICSILQSVHPLDTPSRLKGIETYARCSQRQHSTALDTPSRLKGIETKTSDLLNPGYFSLTLDTPSRLKGIETFIILISTGNIPMDFGYTFPFEGN